MKTEIIKKLKKLALARTTPFCYSCYIKAPAGTCPNCHSDDLMRHLDSVGVEYGTEWVIKHILETELTPIDIDEVFEESIRSIYPEASQIGWMTFNTVDLMKSQDPISWKIARDEYIDSLQSDEEIINFDNGSNYYWHHELESILLKYKIYYHQ